MLKGHFWKDRLCHIEDKTYWFVPYVYLLCASSGWICNWKSGHIQYTENACPLTGLLYSAPYPSLRYNLGTLGDNLINSICEHDLGGDEKILM